MGGDEEKGKNVGAKIFLLPTHNFFLLTNLIGEKEPNSLIAIRRIKYARLDTKLIWSMMNLQGARP